LTSINTFAFNPAITDLSPTIESGTTVSARTEDIAYAETSDEEWAIFEEKNPGVADAYRLSIDGDARYRVFHDHQADENWQDYRVRLGFDIALDDQADLYLRLNTGTQQVGDQQQDNILFDIGQLTVAPNILPGATFNFGKVELPFQTTSTLLFDTDEYTAEGMSTSYFAVNDSRTISGFANAGYFNDVMNGGQIGFQLGDKTYLIGAVGYYDFQNASTYREAMAEIGYDTSSIYGDYVVTVGDNVVSWLAGAKLGIGDVSIDYNYREIDQKSPMADADFPFNNGHAVSVTLPTGVNNLNLNLTHYADWQLSKNQSVGAIVYTF
jgi:hypothetical protein